MLPASRWQKPKPPWLGSGSLPQAPEVIRVVIIIIIVSSSRNSYDYYSDFLLYIHILHIYTYMRQVNSFGIQGCATSGAGSNYSWEVRILGLAFQLSASGLGLLRRI